MDTRKFMAVILLPHVLAYCQEKMVKDKRYRTCADNYHAHMEKHKADNADEVFATLCSPEGRDKFYCMLRYIINCPELMNDEGPASNPLEDIKKPDVEVTSFLYLGTMDNICSMNTGRCSEVKAIFGMIDQEGARVTFDNNYLMFQAKSQQICGEIKDAMTQLLNISKNCPSSLVEKIDEKFETLIRRRMAGEYNALSYKSVKKFILTECPRIAAEFAENMCTKEVFVSKNFTTCIENISHIYTNKRNCDVHEMNEKCVMENVEPSCGEETAKFLARNSHMIFPAIPDNCGSRTSGSDDIRKSFGNLLTVVLFSLLRFN